MSCSYNYSQRKRESYTASREGAIVSAGGEGAAASCAKGGDEVGAVFSETTVKRYQKTEPIYRTDTIRYTGWPPKVCGDCGHLNDTPTAGD